MRSSLKRDGYVSIAVPFLSDVCHGVCLRQALPKLKMVVGTFCFHHQGPMKRHSSVLP